MNKKLLFMAVAGSFALPGVAQAAIDDAGMKYVSASEGLSGSIRIKMLADTDKPDDDPNVAFDDSRLVYRGSTDLGGGLEATYFFEMRPDINENGENGENEDEFGVKYIDAGLKGPFGHLRVGEIEAVTEALLPNADRSNDIGTSGNLLVEDYQRGVRWVSPDINGLVLGVSAEMRETGVPISVGVTAGETDYSEALHPQEDDLVDTWDIVATYSLPMGLNLGGSYAVIANQTGGAGVGGEEDQSGFRLGADYEQDNWGIAYNYHSYKSSDAHLKVPAAVGHEDTEYQEHVVGANVNVSRFNFAFTYSTANLANDNAVFDTDGTDATADVALDKNVKETAVDVAYKLGSKSKVIAAYKVEDIEKKGADAEKSKEWYILYRVDF